MKVTVIGSGYVGLVTGACLSEMGNQVVCLDIDADRVAALERGELPIHEPGLPDIVRRNAAAERLRFSTDADMAVRHGALLFLAVGTPAGKDGAADLQYVMAAARSIGQRMTGYKVIVGKSTVPVGTADLVRDTLSAELARRGLHRQSFAVVANPEFLKEGAAVDDFMQPDRIIVGSDDEQALLMMRALYAPFNRTRDRMLVMDARSAELTKYAANAMLATRISFMNELALLAERVGADIERVRRGMGTDPRIGDRFLHAGAGYGGSCFPKDVKALLKTAADQGVVLQVLRGVEAANERQKRVLVDKVVEYFGEDLAGRHFAMWGLAFKPDTDDMREAPSLVVINELTKRGATVAAYDPAAMAEAARVLGPRNDVALVKDGESAFPGADALLILTEWNKFRTPDFTCIRDTLKHPLVLPAGATLHAAAAAVGLRARRLGKPLGSLVRRLCAQCAAAVARRGTASPEEALLAAGSRPAALCLAFCRTPPVPPGQRLPRRAVLALCRHDA